MCIIKGSTKFEDGVANGHAFFITLTLHLTALMLSARFPALKTGMEKMVFKLKTIGFSPLVEDLGGWDLAAKPSSAVALASMQPVYESCKPRSRL